MEEAQKTIIGQEEAAPVTQQEEVITPDDPGKEATTPSRSGEEARQTVIIREDGALADDWRESLPENIRNEKCLDSIKTFVALAQSYVHAQKAMGAKRLAIPTDSSTPEEWGEFYKALGRPDEEAGYSTEGVKLPEGITLSEDQVGEFRKFAFEHGFNQKTFQEALAFDIERTRSNFQKEIEKQNQEYDDTKARLKEEYGSSMDKVIAQCNKTMDTFGLTEVMREKGLLNNFTVIKALASIGERMSESTLKGGGGATSIKGPEQRLSEIRDNPDDPYYKKDHPAHRAKVAEVNSLLATIAKMN